MRGLTLNAQQGFKGFSYFCQPVTQSEKDINSTGWPHLHSSEKNKEAQTKWFSELISNNMSNQTGFFFCVEIKAAWKYAHLSKMKPLYYLKFN